MSANPHVHALFGEMFDRLFPVIAQPRPLTPEPLPELPATDPQPDTEATP